MIASIDQIMNSIAAAVADSVLISPLWSALLRAALTLGSRD